MNYELKKRNHAFDILCGICIIRMVTLHIMAFCGQDKQDWWLEVMQWSFFFMSFFFFKAGYFNKGTSAWREPPFRAVRSTTSRFYLSIPSFLISFRKNSWPSGEFSHALPSTDFSHSIPCSEYNQLFL